MATRLQDKKADLLERVVDRLHDKLDDPLAALAEAFVHHYYQGVPPADLIDRDPLDLYGAALAHLRFGAAAPAPARPRSGSTTRRSSSTAGSRPTPSSRWSTTTCRSWSIR